MSPGVRADAPRMRMVLRRSLPAASVLALAAIAAPLAAADGSGSGLRAEYFDGTELTGKVAERIDATIDFDWQDDEPVAGVGDDFSVRWTGVLTVPHTERYTFTTRTDDGVRLWIDGRLVIDDWTRHAAAERTGRIDLVAGRAYAIRMEYFDGLRHARARLQWQSASRPKEVIPSSALSPASSGETSDDAPGSGSRAGRPETSARAGAPSLPPPAPPIAGETFNAAPQGGEILVRRPDDEEPIALEQGASLPVGTRVDTRDGEVTMETAPAAGFDGAVQTAVFHGATFEVLQRRRGRRVVTLDMLHGDFESCDDVTPKARRRNVRARSAGRRTRRSGRVVRQLFGRGKGRFRTRGRHAAATVRGTSWQVADRCDETVIKVYEGRVTVEDLLRNRRVDVRAGERYAAKRR